MLRIRRLLLGNYGRKCDIIRNISTNEFQVCVVGSGPAGFYTAQQLLKDSSTKVDVYEKLPVPFGLVRFGVAPDHPEVKNVINTFNKTASHDRFSFYGNVHVGRDISFSDLRKAYHAIVLCYGAENDISLGIPGEDLPNVLSARKFVGWYNGLPEDSTLPVNLNCDTALVIGQGNVALDVARIILTPVDVLKETDITEHALEALSQSSIHRVILIGRRGPLQVAFTIKELREMTKLPNCASVLHREDFEQYKDIVPSLPKPRQRLTDLMIRTALGPKKSEAYERQWELRFLRSPKEITSVASSKLNVTFSVNKLEESNGNVKSVITEEQESIDCGLVLKSVGYRSVQIDPDIPFENKRGVIPNQKGRVLNFPGLYCSGWVRTGPKGVILHTMTDSFETGKLVIEDLHNGTILPEVKPGSENIMKILQEKGITPVIFDDWKKIDKWEQSMGSKRNKPREKMLSIPEMLSVIKREQ